MKHGSESQLVHNNTRDIYAVVDLKGAMQQSRSDSSHAREQKTSGAAIADYGVHGDEAEGRIVSPQAQRQLTQGSTEKCPNKGA